MCKLKCIYKNILNKYNIPKEILEQIDSYLTNDIPEYISWNKYIKRSIEELIKNGKEYDKFKIINSYELEKNFKEYNIMIKSPESIYIGKNFLLKENRYLSVYDEDLKNIIISLECDIYIIQQKEIELYIDWNLELNLSGEKIKKENILKELRKNNLKVLLKNNLKIVNINNITNLKIDIDTIQIKLKNIENILNSINFPKTIPNLKISYYEKKKGIKLLLDLFFKTLAPKLIL